MKTLLAGLLWLQLAHAGDASSVRREDGRFWIECRSALLEEVLREIAEVTPLELWIEEGARSEKVSIQVKGLPLKKALEKLFESASVNFVLYSDPSEPESVKKVYAGSARDSGRLGREPTVAAAPEIPPELDPESLLASPEAQETLGALRDFFEKQRERSEDSSPETEGQPEGQDFEAFPPELQEILKGLSQMPLAIAPPKKDPKPDP